MWPAYNSATQSPRRCDSRLSTLGRLAYARSCPVRGISSHRLGPGPRGFLFRAKKEQGRCPARCPLQPLDPGFDCGCRTAHRGASGLSLPRLGPRGGQQRSASTRFDKPRLSRTHCHHSTQARRGKKDARARRGSPARRDGSAGGGSPTARAGRQARRTSCSPGKHLAPDQEAFGFHWRVFHATEGGTLPNREPPCACRVISCPSCVKRRKKPKLSPIG